MNIREYIEEQTKEVNPDLQKIFGETLREIFTPKFLNEMGNKLKDFIEIVEVDESEGVIAYNVGNKIYINKNTFYDFQINQQARYLLHEFIHLLQRKRGIIFSKFKDIRRLTDKMYGVLKKHLRQPLSVFLTGKNQDIGSGKKWEVLSYFMNNSIDWRAISDEGKRQIVSLLKDSDIFNTDSNFWKRRLPS